jgi:hypothetical protein
MAHRVTFYPEGNADTCLVEPDDGKMLLFDYADRHGEDEEENLCADLSAALGEKLETARRDGFDVVAFTHLDDDHIHGATEFFHLRHALRYLSIAMDQVRSLRTRTIFEHFGRYPGSGVYLLMAKTVREALSEAEISEEMIEQVVARCMTDAEAREAAGFPTNLRKLREAEFDRIHKHGWQVADCNFRVHRPDLFTDIPRSPRHGQP